MKKGNEAAASTDAKLIDEALARVFQNLEDKAGSMERDQRTRDFVFHMTDWKDDLLALADLYRNPSGASQKTWNSTVEAFLIHALGHLLAAAQLSDMVIDPFAVIQSQNTSAEKLPAGARKAS